jgi:nitrogenase subunit NifH
MTMVVGISAFFERSQEKFDIVLFDVLCSVLCSGFKVEAVRI